MQQRCQCKIDSERGGTSGASGCNPRNVHLVNQTGLTQWKIIEWYSRKKLYSNLPRKKIIGFLWGNKLHFINHWLKVAFAWQLLTKGVNCWRIITLSKSYKFEWKKPKTYCVLSQYELEKVGVLHGYFVWSPRASQGQMLHSSYHFSCLWWYF